MREILLYISHDYADWEISYVSTYLKRYSDYQIKTFADSTDHLISMGGLNVIPNMAIEDVFANLANTQMLILCGGSAWRNNNFQNPGLVLLVQEALKQQIMVAAICDASTFLAENGFLERCPHTGNSLEYLTDNCPSYHGQAFFIPQQAVNGGLIISANGTAALEFAREILLALEVASPDAITAWYEFRKKGVFPA